MEFPNFFKYSTVTHFKGENAKKLDADLIMDYDGRKHTRLMKKFYTNKIEEVRLSNECENHEELNREIEKDFYIRCYFPKKQLETINGKASNIVIMINGMNELDRYDFYDRIGEYFAENNIVSILLPTPLNLNRRIESDWIEIEKKKKENKSPDSFPTNRTYSGNLELFHVSYLKTYYELEYLQKLIRGVRDERNNHFYENLFNKNCNISLFGYSLGGLKALGYFLYEFKSLDTTNLDLEVKPLEQYIAENNQKYNSCITFNSGPFLKEVKTETLKINSDNWEYLINGVNKIFYTKQRENLKTNHPELCDLIDISGFLYYGKKDESFDEVISEKISSIINNYLAITAGDDPIVPKDQIQKISPDKPINQIILSEVDHHPGMERSRWHEVLPSVQSNILTFINSCKESHFNRTIVEREIHKILKELPMYDTILKEDMVLAVKHLVTIRSNLRKKELKKFNHYYYVSKAFIPSFDNLLERIRKKVKKEESQK